MMRKCSHAAYARLSVFERRQNLTWVGFGPLGHGGRHGEGEKRVWHCGLEGLTEEKNCTLEHFYRVTSRRLMDFHPTPNPEYFGEAYSRAVCIRDLSPHVTLPKSGQI